MEGIIKLRGFLKQSVEVRRQSTEPGGLYGPPDPLPPETHPARKEIKQRRIRSKEGNEVLASTKVMMLIELQPGDLIDGEEIQDRENIVDIGGKVLGWTYYL